MSELMTVEELGSYLRFTKKTIYRLLKQGDIPAIKIGNKWRFDKDIISDWLHKNLKGINIRVLVIDDDYIITSLFKETLKKQGHTVVTASTGAEGIQYVKQQNFDLVFLDLRLPGLEGAEVFREIRNVKPEPLVIIITGYPGSDMMERALKQGPFGIMNKPFSDSDIVDVVNSFVHAAKPRK
jgi:excisionase family DNA binding protein